jgi:TetR/AcrR family transcriptional regulator, regulator of autoinduction and epiphytic fitness
VTRVTTPVPATDGRSARSQRTREAVVDALLALIRDGGPRPTAREIAERANISLRSVYVHFDDLEDLFLAAAQRQMAIVATMIVPISPALPLAERVETMCNLRGRIFEEVAPVWRAAQLQAPFSPTLSSLLTRVRNNSREGLASLFEEELGAFEPGTRKIRLAALDAAVSEESWDLLRTVHELNFADACHVLVETTMLLLTGPAC